MSSLAIILLCKDIHTNIILSELSKNSICYFTNKVLYSFYPRLLNPYSLTLHCWTYPFCFLLTWSCVFLIIVLRMLSHQSQEFINFHHMDHDVICSYIYIQIYITFTIFILITKSTGGHAFGGILTTKSMLIWTFFPSLRSQVM